MTSHPFDLIYAIVNEGQEITLIQRAREIGALGVVVIRGRGTVSNEMLDMLGLENKNRFIIQMVTRAQYTRTTMIALAKHYTMHKAGHGIVFSIPLIQARGVNAMFRLRDEYRERKSLPPIAYEICGQHEGEEKVMPFEYELIQVVVKSGYADEAMDAAKSAGASGGTIIHARGVGIHENVRLFGVAIEPEKDVLLIVIKKDNAERVMQAVAEKTGLHSPGQGIAFSVPIGRVMGIAHDQDIHLGG